MAVLKRALKPEGCARRAGIMVGHRIVLRDGRVRMVGVDGLRLGLRLIHRHRQIGRAVRPVLGRDARVHVRLR
ncbi:hypothetical protein ACZ75_15890 [Massilia sp. NR 4-1]|nr:hypothetical protein ACZ75_15890 [Massilia sp. NR 4-1]